MVYGHKYDGTIPIFMVLSGFVFCTFAGSASGNALTTLDRQPLRVVLELGALILKIILNIFFIIEFGVIGAAIGSVVVEFVHQGLYIIFATYFLKNSPWTVLFPFIKILPALAIMGMFILLLKNSIHVIPLIFLSAVVYLGGLVVFHYFTPYDTQLIKEILQKPSFKKQ
jgi:O-antigen/teichoic acid export membrane protein